MTSVEISKPSLDSLLDSLASDCADERLFGAGAEAVADALPLGSRNDLYVLLREFRQWDSTVDGHEDRLPLLRPRMLGACRHTKASRDISALRGWCVDSSSNAVALGKSRWWLETVAAFFEIRARWGSRHEPRG